MNKENTLKQLATELQNMTKLGFVADFDSGYIAYEKSNDDLSFEYYEKTEEFENYILNLFLKGEDACIGRIKYVLEKIKSVIQYFLEIGFCFQLDEKEENTIVFEAEKTKSILNIRLNYVLGLLGHINDLQCGITTSQPPAHFTRFFTTGEQRKLFDGLVNGGFLPQKTIYSHFCYVFGAIPIPDNEKPFEPLIWQKSIGLLAYCIDNLFADTDGKNHWEITTKYFLWKNNPPNKDTMKNTVTKYKNEYSKKPKGHERIDDIIKNL